MANERRFVFWRRTLEELQQDFKGQPVIGTLEEKIAQASEIVNSDQPDQRGKRYETCLILEIKKVVKRKKAPTVVKNFVSLK